jgi:hypothetical protein
LNSIQRVTRVSHVMVPDSPACTVSVFTDRL